MDGEYVTKASSQPINESNAYDNSPDQFQEIINFQYYAWGVAGNTIAAFGFFGNMLSIIVLAHRRMRSSTSCYLIALSIHDSLVLVSLVLFMALPVVHVKTNKLQWYYDLYPYLHPFAYPLALTAQTCSIYTIVGFTIERYIAVCHPLKAATWCTISRAIKAILLIIFVSIIYNIPRMLEYRYREVVDPFTNKTTAEYYKTELGQNKSFRHIYFIYLHIAIMLVCPFTVLAVLNTLLIRAVHHSQKVRGQMSMSQQKENNLTVMLISVVVVFLICQVPSIADNILAAIMTQQILDSPPFVKFSVISSLFVIMNSAINFYLYCMFGRKFRKVFIHVLCRCFLYHRRNGFHERDFLSKSSCRYETSTFRANSSYSTRRYENRQGSSKLLVKDSVRNNNSDVSPDLPRKTCIVKSNGGDKCYMEINTLSANTKSYKDVCM